MHFAKILKAFIDIVFGSAQCDHVALTASIREGDLHLVELVADFTDILAFCSNQCLVEALLNYNIL